MMVMRLLTLDMQVLMSKGASNVQNQTTKEEPKPLKGPVRLFITAVQGRAQTGPLQQLCCILGVQWNSSTIKESVTYE